MDDKREVKALQATLNSYKARLRDAEKNQKALYTEVFLFQSMSIFDFIRLRIMQKFESMGA